MPRLRAMARVKQYPETKVARALESLTLNCGPFRKKHGRDRRWNVGGSRWEVTQGKQSKNQKARSMIKDTGGETWKIRCGCGQL